MKTLIKSFHELTKNELYDLLELRCEVFVVEQNCPYQDLDRKDQEAFHLMVYQGDKLMAYTRIFNAGIIYQEAAIGRVVTSPSARNLKLGHQIMKESMEFIRTNLKCSAIRLSAQTHLEKFYEQCGFQPTGKYYLEDDIPHSEMLFQKPT